MEEEWQVRRTDIWREGKYADLWSVVHVLSGAIAGLFPLLVPLSFWPALFTATAFFIAWELVERYGGIAAEYWTNQVTDVLFGIAGFLATYPLLGWENREALWALFFFLWVLALSLSWSGWRAAARARLLHEALLREREKLSRSLARARHGVREGKARFKEVREELQARTKRKRVRRRMRTAAHCRALGAPAAHTLD